jgi:hypothetical protein
MSRLIDTLVNPTINFAIIGNKNKKGLRGPANDVKFAAVKAA